MARAAEGVGSEHVYFVYAETSHLFLRSFYANTREISRKNNNVKILRTIYGVCVVCTLIHVYIERNNEYENEILVFSRFEIHFISHQYSDRSAMVK